jgi:ADP-heptose:LPS heptosyltransferase
MANLSVLLRDVVRRPWYYANSVWLRTYRRLSRRARFDRAIYARAANDLRHYDAIIFAFDSKMIHIGDQLFFLPLIHRLARQGYPVEIWASKAMSRVYPASLMARHAGTRRLYVSRLPALPRIFRQGGLRTDFFAVDGLVIPKEPTGLFKLRAFFDYFSLEPSPHDLDPQERQQLALPVPLSSAYEALRQKRVIILANYIDSGIHRRGSDTVAQMVNDVRDYKRVAGGFVVHLGTADDRDGDKTSYQGLVDFDLRGKTSLADIFGIFCHIPIDRVFTFDTAILHMARMYGHPVQHYWRTRRTKEEAFEVMRAHVHFFDREVTDAEMSR